MNRLGKIKIRHLTQIQKLVWIILLTPCLMNVFIQLLKVPSLIKYIADACWIILLLTMCVKNKIRIPKEIKFIKKVIIIFFFATVILYLINYQSILYYLWGARNNFRFFVLFLASIYYLKQEDIESYLKLLNIFFYINALIMFYQYFVLGLSQDYLGGMFGASQGCNSYTNLFFCIVLALSYLNFVSKKEGMAVFFTKIAIMLVLSAMAELKFFYVEFIIILCVASLITKFSLKKMLLICLAVVAFFIGIRIFSNVFPDINLSFDVLYEYGSSSKGYTNSGDLNRLNFINAVNSKYLTNIFKIMFGLGMGNCDYATGFDFLTSPFYRLYGGIHYTWMSTTHMYLENGLLGLIFIFAFFIYMLIVNLKLSKTHSNPYICKLAALCSIIAIMNLIYNNSLRIETGYMIYFLIAMPWIGGGISDKRIFEKNNF